MRLFLSAVLCTAICCPGAVIDFELTPAINGFGLNGPNEVDALPDSPATGREIKQANALGIFYDDVSRILTFEFGYGAHSAIGGTLLTADFSAVHIHGPAAAGVGGAPPIFDLMPFHSALFTPGDPSTGGDKRSGYVQGSVTLDATQGQQLEDGLFYINVHSVGTYSNGEIRGQLTPVPEVQHYASLFALGLLAFGSYRRFRPRTS